MARSVLLLLAGAMAGGAAVYFFYRPAAPVDPLAMRASGEAAPVADAADLESMLDIAAAQPRSRARDLETIAILGRLAELDPHRAVDFALSAYLDTPLLAEAFAALARADADAAIVKISSVTPAPKQRRIALAILEVIGNDEQGIARLAAALPVEDETSFEIDALLARAESDPLGALQTMIDLDRATLQSLILPRLAAVVARRDPKGALALADSIDDPNVRRSFRLSVMNAWGETNPAGVFEFLGTVDSALLSVIGAVFPALARSDPDRLLAMLERFPPSARNDAKNAVMQAIAGRNPVEAIAMLDTIPPGQERQRLLQVIARSYGRDNPDLALAWVRSLTPPSNDAMQAVLQGIAATDVDRAIDVMIAELDQQRAAPAGNSTPLASSFSMILSMMAGDGADVSRLADRLLHAAGPQVSPMMSSVVSIWAERDGEAALSWTLANASELDNSVLRSLSQRIANENLDIAMATLDRLPADKRAGWIEGLAARMAAQDVDQAVGFLERYRGQPGYDQAYGTVLNQIAHNDPVRAAGMLSNAPESRETMSAIFAISREWATRDPAAAGRWAMDSIRDTELQSSAIGNIASTWVQRDAAAAERWIFSMSSGAARDAAVNGYLGAAAQVGQFQPRLLEAYSSEAAAQRGAGNAIVQMGRTDPEEARRLLELYVTDPAVRGEAETRLARGDAVGNGIFISNGNVILRN